jgi:hypothetical protein
MSIATVHERLAALRAADTSKAIDELGGSLG